MGKKESLGVVKRINIIKGKHMREFIITEQQVNTILAALSLMQIKDGFAAAHILAYGLTENIKASEPIQGRVE